MKLNFKVDFSFCFHVEIVFVIKKKKVIFSFDKKEDVVVDDDTLSRTHDITIRRFIFLLNKKKLFIYDIKKIFLTSAIC